MLTKINKEDFEQIFSSKDISAILLYSELSEKERTERVEQILIKLAPKYAINFFKMNIAYFIAKEKKDLHFFNNIITPINIQVPAILYLQNSNYLSISQIPESFDWFKDYSQEDRIKNFISETLQQKSVL